MDPMTIASLLGGIGGMFGKGGGSTKVTQQLTNATNINLNPTVVALSGQGAIAPQNAGSASSSASQDATQSDTNPSSQIPWSYGNPARRYNVDEYPLTMQPQEGIGLGLSSNTLLLLGVLLLLVMFTGKSGRRR